MPIYAIGDIHGHLDKLEYVHDLIATDRAREGSDDAPVVHVGDLCDRGPDTKGVIDFLIAGQARGENWVALKGNHDRLMGYFLETPPRNDTYLMIGWDWFHEGAGGRETLASYGIEVSGRERFYELADQARAVIPEAHRFFVQDLPTFYETDEQIFVHAGIRPGIPLAEQSETDLLWIRQEFHNYRRDHGKLIVHGHTPIDTVTHYGNRLNLDTGAGYGKAVSAVVIEGREVWLLAESGRVKVDPHG